MRTSFAFVVLLAAFAPLDAGKLREYLRMKTNIGAAEKRLKKCKKYLKFDGLNKFVGYYFITFIIGCCVKKVIIPIFALESL